ncbi:hypothetical protein M0L20_29220 [Spirosoma sp. RP8]|uniref:Uncharacterized protein n=1 Tax=Spirosoma liriopis TaxID=2937440 RepID=A0ABT0HVU2_9BACT|nr:hypothetical protein [Spirosoma liriopis]MCK8495982.1 hypothetical protein [Spirosoma liriopis]
MKMNYIGLLASGLVCVIVIAMTGNYLFAYPADFFFLAAGLSYRRQRRLIASKRG